jgi:hypothetical protein
MLVCYQSWPPVFNIFHVATYQPHMLQILALLFLPSAAIPEELMPPTEGDIDEDVAVEVSRDFNKRYS